MASLVNVRRNVAGLDFRQAKIDCQSLQDRLDALLKAKEETEG